MRAQTAVQASVKLQFFTRVFFDKIVRVPSMFPDKAFVLKSENRRARMQRCFGDFYDLQIKCLVDIQEIMSSAKFGRRKFVGKYVFHACTYILTRFQDCKSEITK